MLSIKLAVKYAQLRESLRAIGSPPASDFQNALRDYKDGIFFSETRSAFSICYFLVSSIVIDQGRKECTRSCRGHYTLYIFYLVSLIPDSRIQICSPVIPLFLSQIQAHVK